MNIFEALNKVMEEVGAIGKNSTNKTQGYQYRGVDAVMNALQPALINNKVFVVPEVLEHTREERTTSKGGVLLYSIIKVKYHFYAEDGSEVTATVIGEGMDSSDKSSNKAMSVAFKYACFQVLCIPTEEMLDSEASDPINDADKKTVEANKPATITGEQKAQILAECNRTGVKPSEVAKMFNLSEIDDIPESQFAKLYKSMLNWNPRGEK